MTLQSLLTRAQQATGADRELDVLLHAVLVEDRAIRWSGNLLLGRANNPPHDECVLGSIDPGVSARNFSSGYSKPTWPDYTASVDAALGLVERVLPGWVVNLTTGDPTRVQREVRLPSVTLVPHILNDAGWKLGAEARRPQLAPTPALALICALLTAKIAEASTPHEEKDS